MSDALVLDGVHAHYGRSHVLHEVGFALRKGRLLALLGRNGAGKTTTMLTIAGLLKATGGRITASDRAIEQLAPETIARLGVRLVPQGRRVFPSLTVQENLTVAAQKRPAASPWSVERVFELFPQLRPRHRQRAGTLSGGEQQMLAMARALMSHPKLLLLDEPSMGLSPIMVEKIFEVIRKVSSEGITILLVEQNARLALQAAHRGYVMDSGLVTMGGNAAAMLDDPRVKAAYLGE